MNCDFVIRNQDWARVASWIIAAIGLTVVAVMPVFYLTDFISYGVFVILEVCGAVFALIGVLCVYVCLMEKFELKDGVFFYRKPFKKSQSASVQDVAKVVAYGSFRLYDVVFYDKDGKKLIHFYDDGTAFLDGKFEAALVELKIPYSKGARKL